MSERSDGRDVGPEYEASETRAMIEQGRKIQERRIPTAREQLDGIERIRGMFAGSQGEPEGVEIRSADHEEAMRLHAALYSIAHMTTSMPPAHNDSATWYRNQLWEAIGRAARAITPTDSKNEPSGNRDDGLQRALADARQYLHEQKHRNCCDDCPHLTDSQPEPSEAP